MQQRKPGNWSHHQPGERHIHDSGRHHEINAHRLKIPNESADSPEAELLCAGDRHCVSTAGTDGLERLDFATNDGNHPIVDSEVLATWRPIPRYANPHDLISIHRVSGQLV